jgi:diaminopimelate decarboxylase
MSPAPPRPSISEEKLIEIARDVGTPTYIYDESIIRRQISQLRDMVAGIPTKLLYAVKANYHPKILQILREEGLGFDVVSPGEAALVRRLGTPPEDVLYSANNMSDAEMHHAIAQDLLLNIGERSRLERFGRAFPGAEVCLRVNPNIGAGHHEHVITAGKDAKFGIPVDEIAEVRQIAAAHDLRVVGLHQHIGSGILEVDTLWSAMEVLLDAAELFAGLEFINFGGGLGIPYTPEDQPLDPTAVQQAIVPPLQKYRQNHHSSLTYWLEPGRYLVGECGVLLATVTTVKKNDSRTFAGTDTGLNHLLRPALYGAYHGIYNLSHPDGPLVRYDVTGNICESGDLFARDRPVQKMREGDILAINDAGAYGMSMASHYNLRTLPAEVLLSKDGSYRTITRRLKPDELLDHLGFLTR